MSGWRDALTGLADAGERLAEPPDAEDVRRRVRRRKAARVAFPAGTAVAVLVAGALVLPGLFRQPLDAAGQLANACGQPVSAAAAAAFDAQAVGPGEGVADVRASSNAVVEQGNDLAVAVAVSHRASGVAEYAVAPAGEAYLVAWLVQDDRVVGVLDPEDVIPPSGNVTPDAEVYLDGSYRLISCDGGWAPVGEYSIVVAVGLTPVLDGGADQGATAAVLSEPIPLRIGEPDPLAELGACGSAWPDAVVSSTDGYELGLRIGSDVDGLTVTGGVALETEVTVTNDGTEELAGWTGHPYLVIIADGMVVADTGGMDGEGLDATLAPGASLDYRGGLPLTQCGSDDPLAPGTYEVYAIMSFFFDSPAGTDGPEGTRTDVTAVGGPWEITIG